VRRRVTEASDVLELKDHLERKPANLSGGQRQRVAMGRAIVRQAEAFLFDEPLSNLDAKLRGQMRTEISRLQRRLGITTVYVTHDQTEAMTLGDRVCVLRKGIIQQVASPRELYEQPVNLFVAGFIGSPPMNFLPAQVEGNRLDTPFGVIELDERQAAAVGGRDLVMVGIRPEYFEDAAFVEDSKRHHGTVFTARVDVKEWLGDSQYAYIPYEAPESIRTKLAELSRELDSEELRTQAIVSIDASSRLREGRDAEFWLDTRKIHVFDPESGDNLTRDEQAGAELTRLAEQDRIEQTEDARNEVAGRDRAGRDGAAGDGAAGNGSGGAHRADGGERTGVA
jgi:multiple sugar transport system ATP-binding protein